MPRIVVLGTGTDAGKTWVGCALARAFRRLGKQVCAVKPIESGYSPEHSDAARLATAAGHPMIVPLYRFPDAVSPHLAARLANSSISLKQAASWTASHDSALHYTIVETAGGVFSPLTDGACNVDLARALAPAQLLLVAPDRLGVLHQLTATLLALDRDDLAIDHVVLSAVPPPDASTGTNAAELERLAITRVRAVLREDGDADRFVRLLI